MVLLIDVGAEILTTTATHHIHQYTQVGTHNLTISKSGRIEVLIVGGGGAGGTGINFSPGGGGGGGNVVYVSNYYVTKGDVIPIVVGAGGVRSTTSGTNGGDSSFGAIIAIGGGAGGTPGVSNGLPGGSGGGGGRGAAGGSTIKSTGLGFNGGSSGGVLNSTAGGGGGGGATQSGFNSGGGNRGANGGQGYATTISGLNEVYGSGGGGGRRNDGQGSGGTNAGNGGGGSAVSNRGGGGGGGQGFGNPYVQAGGFGGSGIVIIRYPIFQTDSLNQVSVSGGSTLNSMPLAFHYRAFDLSRDTYNDGSVENAALNGRIYSNTTLAYLPDSFAGTFSVSTSSTQTTYVWTPYNNVDADILLVAGGGGGGKGYSGGGGGGGGGVVQYSQRLQENIPVTIVVGNGGSGAQSRYNQGTNGFDSSLNNIIAKGGGGGGSRDSSTGLSGGSGGGGASGNGAKGGSTQSTNNVSLALLQFGNDGGLGSGGASGGGGAGGAGTDGVTDSWIGRDGGDGAIFTQFGTNPIIVGAGGGSGATSPSGIDAVLGKGGSGIGGDGGFMGADQYGEDATPPTAGKEHTGSGGGGSGGSGTTAGNGGSGIVLIMYRDAYLPTTTIQLDANEFSETRVDNTPITSWNGYAAEAVGNAGLPVVKTDEPFRYVRFGTPENSATVGNYLDVGDKIITRENPKFTGDTSVVIDSDYGWDTNTGWVVSGSPVFDSRFAIWKGFNKTIVDGDDCWLSLNIPSDTSPVHLRIEYPYPVSISSYEITSRNAINFTRFPTKWVLQGSNDNTLWVNLEVERTESLWNGTETKKFSDNVNIQNNAYKYYQLLIKGARQDNTDATARQPAIGNLTLYTSKTQTWFGRDTNPPFTSNTTVALESNSGWNTNIGWKAAASSFHNAIGGGETTPFEAWKGLNKIIIASSNCWLGNVNNIPSLSQPEWISIEYPYPVCISSYEITSRNNSIRRLPTKWVLQGSNNTIEWVDLEEQRTDSTSTWSAGQTKQFSDGINIENNAYKYYRLLIYEARGDSNVTALAAPAIGNWSLYMRPGFTAVGVIRFWAAKTWQRWFDFGNGTEVLNILYGKRTSDNVGIQFRIFNNVSLDTTDPYIVPVGNGWHIVVARATTLTDVSLLETWSDPNSALEPRYSQVGAVSVFTKRTLINNYIGKANWPTNHYSCLDIRETSFYDYSLSDSDLKKIVTHLRLKYGFDPSLQTSGIISLADVGGLLQAGQNSIRQPTSISGLDAWYIADSWSVANNRWDDISGNNRHTISTKGSVNVTNSTDTSGRTVKSLVGDTSSGIRFPTSVLPSTFTLFHLTRYTGGTRRRIITAIDRNWLSGFHNNNSGVAYHNTWITPQVNLFGDNWVLSVSQNNIYRANGIQRSTYSNATLLLNANISIGNYGGPGGGETSNWACSEVIVYNRTLSVQEIEIVEQYLRNKLTPPSSSLTMNTIRSQRNLSAKNNIPRSGKITMSDFYGLGYSGNPANIPNLYAWYNSDSWYFTRWTDMSGNNRHASSINASNLLSGSLIRRRFTLNSTTVSLYPSTFDSGFNNTVHTELIYISDFNVPNGDFMGFEYTGWLVVDTEGIYTFGLRSDDGSDFAVFLDGEWIIITDNYGYHGVPIISPSPGTIYLTDNVHYPIRLRFHEQSGGQGLNLDWIQPSQSTFSAVPFSIFRCPPTVVVRSEGFPNPAVSLGQTAGSIVYVDDIQSIDTNGRIVKKSLRGDINTSIIFPNDVLPQTFTLFHLTRYTGGMKRRIFQGINSDWLNGFHDGKSGVAFHGSWLTQNNVSSFGDEWVLSCSQNNMYRANGNQQSIYLTTGISQNIAINTGAITLQTSHWACSEVIVYDRLLSIEEIELVERHIRNSNEIEPKYGLSGLSASGMASLVAAYSFRRCNHSYLGPAVKVQNTRTSILMDFYPTIAGVLHAGSRNSGITLSDWLGEDTGLIHTWYDQSGRGKHADQGTNKPLILLSADGICMHVSGTQSLAGPNVFDTTSVINMHLIMASKEIGRGQNAVISLNGNTNANPGRFFVLSPWTDGIWYADFGDTGGNRVRSGITEVGTNIVFSGYKSFTLNNNGFRLNGGERYVSSGFSSSAIVSGGIHFGMISTYQPNHHIFSTFIFSAKLSEADERIVEEYSSVKMPLVRSNGALDLYKNTGVVAAYALRRLFSTYTGPQIRVKRSGDNVEHDVYYDKDGREISVPTLVDFITSSYYAYVVTWYDQSGKGNHGTGFSTPVLDFTTAPLKHSINLEPLINGNLTISYIQVTATSDLIVSSQTIPFFAYMAFKGVGLQSPDTLLSRGIGTTFGSSATDYRFWIGGEGGEWTFGTGPAANSNAWMSTDISGGINSPCVMAGSHIPLLNKKEFYLRSTGANAYAVRDTTGKRTGTDIDSTTYPMMIGRPSWGFAGHVYEVLIYREDLTAGVTPVHDGIMDDLVTRYIPSSGGALDSLNITNTNITPSTVTPIYTTASVAYSVRRLFTEYNGPQMRVRNSVTSTQADIYTDSHGNIVRISGSTTTDLATWLNGGHVTYDTSAAPIITAYKPDDFLVDPNAFFTGIVWAPEIGLFAAVSFERTNSVITSPDGINWTARAAAVNNEWNAITWAPELGLFAAVARDGNNRVMTSPDGITWKTQSTFAGDTSRWSSIEWSPELGLFAAVAAFDDSNNNLVMTSPDGINWKPYAVTGTSWNSIAWAPELGLFVVVADAYFNNYYLMTSSDGKTWNSYLKPSADFTKNWRAVTWAPELGLFVAVAAMLFGTTNHVMTSSNGIDWQVRAAFAGDDNGWRAIAWAPELGLFAAVADNGDNRVMTSPDGITWTPYTSVSANTWYGIAWAPKIGVFAAAAIGGNLDPVMTIQYPTVKAQVQVVVWYDQSGGVIKDASSYGTNEQPILEQFEGKLAIRFNGTIEKLNFADTNVLGVYMEFYALAYTNNFITIFGRSGADRSFRFVGSAGNLGASDWLISTNSVYSINTLARVTTGTSRPMINLNIWNSITASRSTTYTNMNEIGKGSWSGGYRGLNGYLTELIFTSTANQYNNNINTVHGSFYNTRYTLQSVPSYNNIFESPLFTGTTALLAAPSINYLRALGVNTSGTYWLKPDGYTGSAFQAYIDFDNDGGGWVLIAKYGGSNKTTDKVFNTDAYDTGTNTLLNTDFSGTSTYARFSREQMNFLWKASSGVTRVHFKNDASTGSSGVYFQRKITNIETFDFWKGLYNTALWADGAFTGSGGNAYASHGGIRWQVSFAWGNTNPTVASYQTSVQNSSFYNSNTHEITFNGNPSISDSNGYKMVAWDIPVNITAPPNNTPIVVTRHMGFFADITAGNQWLLTSNPNDSRFNANEARQSVIFLRWL